MEEIIIHGVDKEKEPIKFPVKRNDTYFHTFFRGFAKIDLTPLKYCQDIRSISLNVNDLEEVDLRPISFLKRLEGLHLRRNKLKGIDLRPLKNLIHLKFIDLSENNLKKIDLTPICLCPSLETINLSKNEIKAIDLSPLENCFKLKDLNLCYNSLSKINLSPLSSLNNLENFIFFGNPLKEDVVVFDPEIKGIREQEKERYHEQSWMGSNNSNHFFPITSRDGSIQLNLQLLYGNLCNYCSYPIKIHSKSEGSCWKIKNSHIAYIRSMSPYYRSGKDDFSSAIRNAKDDSRYAKLIADAFIRVSKKDWFDYSPYSLIIPVPNTDTKNKQTVSKILGRLLAEKLNIEIREDILLCQSKDKARHKTTTQEREIIVKGKFTYRHDKKIYGKSVIIVDDIVTSGSTITYCAGLLKKAGAGKIIALTAGRTI